MGEAEDFPGVKNTLIYITGNGLEKPSCQFNFFSQSANFSSGCDNPTAPTGQRLGREGREQQ
jgi:hypothetical protein